MLLSTAVLLWATLPCYGKPPSGFTSIINNIETFPELQLTAALAWETLISNYRGKPYEFERTNSGKTNVKVTLPNDYHLYSQREYTQLEHEIHTRSVPSEPDAITKDNRLLINGLDCRNPTRIRNGLVRNLCHIDNQGPPAPEVVEAVTILQKSTNRITKAYRCKKYMSKLTTSCGSFIPDKMYGPPDILQEVPISSMDCQRAIKRRTFQTETGNIIKVNINTVYTYKYILKGNMAVSPENVECRGSYAMINGQEYKSTIAMINARVEFSEITLEIRKDAVVDLDANTKLPESCRLTSVCDSGHVSYVRTRTAEVCPLYLIRSIPMIKINLGIYYDNQTAYISQENKMLIVAGPDEVTETSCGTIRKVGGTQYPHLKILHDGNTPVGSIQKILMSLEPSQLELELELKSSLEYESYMLEKQMTQQLYTMGSNLCMMNRQELQQTEISPFHENSVLRISGDIVKEIQCKAIIAEVRLGDDRGYCYDNVLPIWYNNLPLFLTARDKLIVEENTLSMIPCEAETTSILRTNDGRFVQATPIVETIEFSHLQRIEAGYVYHTNDPESHHQEFSRDLLYQDQQVESMEHMLYFGRAREHVLDSLVNQYCYDKDQKSAPCGEYRPPHPGEFEFEVSHLKSTISEDASWGEYLHNNIQSRVNYCNIAVLMYIIVMLLARMVKTFICVYYHGERVSLAIQQNFFACIQVYRRVNRRRKLNRGGNSDSYRSATSSNATEMTFLHSRIRTFRDPGQL